MDDKILLNSEQVANRLAISIRTLWRLVKAGKLPEPLRYSRKLVRWRSSDIAEAVRAFQDVEPYAPRKKWSER